MKIVDKRHSLTVHGARYYQRRTRRDIQFIAIHHSATVSGSAEAFAAYHVTQLGWPGIGYHYVVDKEGIISWCHSVETVSYHVGNSNAGAIGICLVGDFRQERLQPVQRAAAVALTKSLMQELGIPKERVLGHQEFPGYQWKACPAFSMSEFRRELTKGGTKALFSKGDKGPEVKAIQQRLKELGFSPGPIDGMYGPQTAAAVIHFQQQAGIAVDGITGPETWGRLFG
ncbi:peptidoglycan recognition protein family protein [Halalkalibacter oceani]|uniref:peptidoglycan recognition protein family protein n=1 Tax=Halalkalibacter oceani TaxID=1653776 RepID=UPI00339403B8